jgi:hypothetical protein
MQNGGKYDSDIQGKLCTGRFATTVDMELMTIR